MYLATLKPSSITVRYEKQRESIHTQWATKLCRVSSKSLDNLKVKKSSFGLSSQSKAKLLDSINFMHSVSRARTQKVSSKKSIYNFKTSFITLTLPSAQIHSDIEIKKCLNNFLTTLRTVYNVRNYVWKAELQRNDNIHFHIVLDIFINHYAVRHYWNKSLETLGYVSRYRAEWCGLSLKEYANKRKVPIVEAISGFQKGNDTNWSNPATEEVKAVRSNGQLAFYLAKYMVKSVQKSINNGGSSVVKSHISISELVRLRKFGRVWARSQSLSKIKFITRYSYDDLISYVKSISNIKIDFSFKNFEYCSKYYLDFKTVNKKLVKWFALKMSELGITYNYPFPTTLSMA